MQHLQFCFESKLDRYRIGNASCPECFRNSKSCCDSFRPRVHSKQSRRAPPILLRTATARPSERTSDFMQPDSGQLQAALLNAWNSRDSKAQNDWLLGSKKSKQARCRALTTVSSCYAYALWLHHTMSYSQSRWRSFLSDSQRLDFAPCGVTFLCSFWARPQCDRDVESLVHSCTALRKQKWLGDVQTWKTQALFSLEKFTLS